MNKTCIFLMSFSLVLLFPLISESAIVKEGVIEYAQLDRKYDYIKTIIIRFDDGGRQMYTEYFEDDEDSDQKDNWEKGNQVRINFNPTKSDGWSFFQTIENLSKGITQNLNYNGWVSPESYKIVKIENPVRTEPPWEEGRWNLTLDDGSKWYANLSDEGKWQIGDSVAIVIPIFDTPKAQLKYFINNPFPLRATILDDNGAQEKMAYVFEDAFPPFPLQLWTNKISFFNFSNP